MMENEFIMMENDNNIDNDKVNNHIHFSVISFLYHLIMFPIFSLLCTIPEWGLALVPRSSKVVLRTPRDPEDSEGS